LTDPATDAEARLAIRELVDAYALGVDRKAADDVASLFAREGRLVSLFGPGSPQSPFVRQGRERIATALSRGLAVYLSTTHIVGSHGAEVSGDRASGETRCLAHHVYERDGLSRLLVMAVHYGDRYLLEDGRWCFEERRLSVDWRNDTVLEAT